jgi:hypothetical protein
MLTMRIQIDTIYPFLFSPKWPLAVSSKNKNKLGLQSNLLLTALIYQVLSLKGSLILHLVKHVKIQKRIGNAFLVIQFIVPDIAKDI